jgi:nucleoside-diphosphate-sugar epimerase
MKVFVTGATGYIGRSLVRALHRAGHEVVGLARSLEKARGLRLPGIAWIGGDLREPSGWAETASVCDGLVHLAMDPSGDGPDADRTALEAVLAAARKSGDPRVAIYTSGIWVLGETDGADETSPVRPAELVVWRPVHEQQALHAGSGPVVAAVVRPAIVMGGRGGITEGLFSGAATDGAPTVVGDGTQHWPMVHRDDTADLYLRLLELGPTKVRGLAAQARIFHAVGEPGESVADIARAAGLAAGGDGTVRSWPLPAARKELGAFADALALDQTIRASRSEEVLGWRPRWRGFARNAEALYAEWKAGA